MYVRLCVERKTESGSNAGTLNTSSTSPEGKSPKIFGLPKPYIGLYSASSYMANRPSYVRSREPGQYTLDSSSNSDKKISTSSTSSLGRLPGMSGLLASSETTSPVAQSNDDKVRELVSKLPPAPSKIGTTTEVVTKRTFTETSVKRVTKNEVKVEDVVLVKAGGPLGLSIIGGSDHSCVPFGPGGGESGIFISKVISEVHEITFYQKITIFFSTDNRRWCRGCNW